MVLKTELSDGVVRLRPMLKSDAEELTQAVQKSIPELMPWMSWCHEGYNKQDALQWLNTLPSGWDKGTDYSFAITDIADGQIVGGCGLSFVNTLFKFGNVGYWVRSDRTGEGIASRSALLVARFAFEKIGLVRAEIVVAVENQASIRVAEKVGATREGILRNRLVVREHVLDAAMYSLTPDDFDMEVKR
jgi:RimJ/RimL family protein N-acetyltransferase